MSLSGLTGRLLILALAAPGAVLAQPQTREKLRSVGVELFEDSPANFRRFVSGEIAKWRKVVKAANLKLD